LEPNARKEALDALHELVLELGGNLGQKTYFQYLSSSGLKPGDWRPSMLALMDKLRYDPAKQPECSVWLSTARAVMAPFLASTAGTIGQELPNHQDLIGVLGAMPLASLVPRTIHSVKGRQFPGVCVVLSPSTCKGIVDYLTTGAPSENAENARKLYVAASRARRLLVIAIPKSQGPRLIAHIEKTGADVSKIALP
jgi:DNA helicase II / ATP-dependent DNA helicase PcrA